MLNSPQQFIGNGMHAHFIFDGARGIDGLIAMLGCVGCRECVVPAALPGCFCEFCIIRLEVVGYFLGQFA